MSRSRAPRNTLSRDRVVAAALESADQYGLESLTMRGLAAKLGVQPMALYHYVATKEELLDVLVDVVFAEIYIPRADGDWREELARRSQSLRDALRRHSWALSLMETRVTPGEANLGGHEAVLEVLRTSGFSVEATANAYAVLDAFVYGFALQEAMLRTTGLEDAADELAQGMDLSRHPRIAEQAAHYVAAREYPFAATFDAGLGFMLDGIATLRSTSS